MARIRLRQILRKVIVGIKAADPAAAGRSLLSLFLAQKLLFRFLQLFRLGFRDGRIVEIQGF